MTGSATRALPVAASYRFPGVARATPTLLGFHLEDQTVDNRTPPQNQAILRLESNGATALDRLYRSHAGWLHRTLGRRLGGTAIEVEDLVQETWLRAARYDQVDETRHPRALLLRIAINLARDQMRRAKARGRPAPLAANDAALLSEPGAEGDQEYLLELKRVVLGLPPDLRNVFVLTRFTGMSYADVARQLGVSVKTVEWRMTKALAICAQLLSD